MVKPYLENKINHSWVDPRGKDDGELLYEYKLGWAFAQASSEILLLVEKMVEEAEAITKKEKGENEDKLRKAVS